MSNEKLLEALAIRTVVDNWVLWRDAGDWDRFRTVWHDDGYMMATWFQGTADEFIRVSQEGFNRGVNILHFQGAFTADIEGARAVSQTKMTINQRALVHDVLVRRGLHRTLLRFLREAEQSLGHRAEAADLREGSHGPGGSRKAAAAGSGAA